MKNHRFLWLRNRTTDNRKCEKARNIKEKRTIEMFSTVSKQLVALRSSASDNRLLRLYQNGSKTPGNLDFPGFCCRQMSNKSVTVHAPLSREVFWHEYAKISRHTSQNSIAAGNLE